MFLCYVVNSSSPFVLKYILFKHRFHCQIFNDHTIAGHITVEISLKNTGHASQLLVDGKVFGKMVKAGQNKIVEKVKE